MTSDNDDNDELALDHGWNWFALHAAQRMQTFHFFLIATAFLFAAYGTTFDKNHWVAMGTAIVGAWIGFWFTRLDNRTKQLIEAGEAVLEASQSRLAKETNIPQLEILKKVETPVSGACSYAAVIAVVEWSIVGVFILAAIVAGFQK
jgi:hypothetical protein